jgi:hypothetical protein
MRLFQLLILLAAVMVWSAAAQAVPQFVPTGTARLHTLGSGQLGAEWNTGGLGAGGEVSYDSGTQTLSMDAVLDTMNWYDPANGSCPTDVGSNCSLNFGPDLDISLTASFDSVVVTPLGGGLFGVTVNFGTAGGVDLTITDPADGDSIQLKASVAAGTFMGTPTSGLAASVVFDSAGSGSIIGGVNVVGFLAVDVATPFASLFLPDYFGIQLSAFSDFDDGLGGTLVDIVATTISSGSLPDFTAEANGQILATVTGAFVPEPGTLLLLSLAGLAILRRR